MGSFDKYLDRARDLAEEAGDIAKNMAGDVVSRAKKLSDEGSLVRELTQNAKEQTAAFSQGAREKIQSALQDARAGKEIRQGLAQLETMPEIDGSILYKLELESTVNYLNSLLLIISDGRLDNDSVVEEIQKVMSKVQPAVDSQEEGIAEQQAIENAKTIAYNACTRALEALNVSADEA